MRDRVLDQDPVQAVAARRQPIARRHRHHGSLEDALPDVAAGAHQPPEPARLDVGEDAELPERGDGGRREEVGGERVAREVVTVDEVNATALAPEQEREAGARDARADDEDVEIVRGHVRSTLLRGIVVTRRA